MSFRTYRIWKGLTTMVLAVLVVWAVSQGIAWIPIPAAVVALFIMFITRRAVKEVVVDERSYTIANQASRVTFQAGAIIMVFVGVTLGVAGVPVGRGRGVPVGVGVGLGFGST